ncbi:MAG TPA: DUF4203 domain-containing protein [Trueperaceae bacterium]|nr:DUF4203 domain-containing protein [Trueperaceae bacterium]
MQTPQGFDPWRWWRSLEPQQRLLAGAVQIAIGLAMTFFGFRLFRAFLAISGFVLGASVGLSVGQNMSQTTAWILAVALGLVGALVLWALFRIGALLAGAALGAAVAQAVAVSVPGAATGQWQWLFLLVGLVVGAILGWVLQRPLIIIATALSGAWGAVAGVAMLLGRATPDQAVPATLGSAFFAPGATPPWQGGGTLWLAGALVLALLGIAFQLRDTGHLGRRRF